MIHVIPSTEADLHDESQECPCGPKMELDPESGEMVWWHQIMDFNRLFDGFVED